LIEGEMDTDYKTKEKAFGSKNTLIEKLRPGKAYIAAPYTSRSVNIGDKAYGDIVDNDYKEFLEGIEAIAKEAGLSTHLPHKDANKWERYI
jgi:hypothetical protein